MISDAHVQELADSPKLLQNELLGFRRNVLPGPRDTVLASTEARGLSSYLKSADSAAPTMALEPVMRAITKANQFSFIQVRRGWRSLLSLSTPLGVMPLAYMPCRHPPPRQCLEGKSNRSSSSPSEDYLTVLAGQRQWIATINCAGCPGQIPDSFANSAVLTTSAKVPDALGWPIAPCFPVQIDPKAEQFEQVVARADQRPFAVHLLQSPQQELPESPALLDLTEYRLHSLHPQSVALPTPLGL